MTEFEQQQFIRLQDFVIQLQSELLKLQQRVTELEGRMPLGPIGPSFPPPPSWPWPVPIVTKTGAVICGGDTEVTKTGDCTAEIRDKRWLGTV